MGAAVIIATTIPDNCIANRSLPPPSPPLYIQWFEKDAIYTPPFRWKMSVFISLLAPSSTVHTGTMMMMMLMWYNKTATHNTAFMRSRLIELVSIFESVKRVQGWENIIVTIFLLLLGWPMAVTCARRRRCVGLPACLAGWLAGWLAGGEARRRVTTVSS